MRPQLSYQWHNKMFSFNQRTKEALFLQSLWDLGGQYCHTNVTQHVFALMLSEWSILGLPKFCCLSHQWCSFKDAFCQLLSRTNDWFFFYAIFTGILGASPVWSQQIRFFISAHNRHTRNLAMISTSVPYFHGPFPLTEKRKKKREKDHGSAASALRARRVRMKDGCLGITLSLVPAWLWPLARPRAVCMERAIASSSSAHWVFCPKNHRPYCVCYLICKFKSFSAFWCELSPLLLLCGLSRGRRIFCHCWLHGCEPKHCITRTALGSVPWVQSFRPPIFMFSCTNFLWQHAES